MGDTLIDNQLKLYEGVGKPELEYLWMGTAFNVKLLEYNGMFLHSSTVVVDGKAYSFSVTVISSFDSIFPVELSGQERIYFTLKRLFVISVPPEERV